MDEEGSWEGSLMRTADFWGAEAMGDLHTPDRNETVQAHGSSSSGSGQPVPPAKASPAVKEEFKLTQELEALMEEELGQPEPPQDCWGGGSYPGISRHIPGYPVISRGYPVGYPAKTS